LIWVDFLVGRFNHRPKQPWKFQGFVLMTWLNSMSLWTLFAFPRLFGINTFLLEFPSIAGTRLISGLSFFIQFTLVFCFVNYFLIFYRDRYKKILKKYPYSGGRLVRNYFFITVGSSLFTVLLFVFYKGKGG
jgi:hypothetical protein